jgi:hypothetical protein
MNYYSELSPPLRCSIPGMTTCSYDWQCLQSCPFGDIPAERMACGGSVEQKQFGQGVCQAAWSEEGDACVVGSDNACSPTADGYNDLYCAQTQLGNANTAPDFSQAKVGNGTCRRRTLAATNVGAEQWTPAVPASDWNGVRVPSGVEVAQQPVNCTDRYLTHLREQGLLRCDKCSNVRRKADTLCANTVSATCDNTGNMYISLL